MKRSMKAFIVTSVLLNLLFVGILCGREGRHFWGHKRAEEIARALPADKFALYQKTMDRMEEEKTQLRKQSDEARKRSMDLLKAEPFNRQAYLAQVKNMHNLRGQMMEHMAQAVAGIAEEFLPEERAILAETLRRPHPRKECGPEGGKK